MKILLALATLALLSATPVQACDAMKQEGADAAQIRADWKPAKADKLAKRHKAVKAELAEKTAEKAKTTTKQD